MENKILCPAPVISNSIFEEKIKSLEKEIILKDELIKLKDEIINSKDKLLKANERIINSINEQKPTGKTIENETKTILNESYFPINPPLVKMKYKGNEYKLSSHRYWDNDKINDNNSNIFIYKGSSDGDKWIFERDNNNLYTIIFDNNRDGMFNWKLFSDKKKVVLSKNLFSKFEITQVNKENNYFYFKDHKSGKYLCNDKKKRDDVSFNLSLCDEIDLVEEERFIFYI